MKILIAGSGIGGLAMACFLEKNTNFKVTIIEREKDWSHIGFTIGIWKMGVDMLAKLGLDRKFLKDSIVMNTLEIKSKDNILIRSLNMNNLFKSFKGAYVHTNRETIHKLLLKKYDKKVVMEKSIKQITFQKEKAVVLFNSGGKEEFDVVIGADGVKSNLRKLVFKKEFIKKANTRSWYAWIPKKYVKKATITEIIDKNAICNLFDNPKKACMVLTMKGKLPSFDDEVSRLKRLKEAFKSSPQVIDILSKLKEKDLLPVDLHTIKCKQWFKRNVVFIGDAVHAIEPFAGLGASLAMEDAYTLSVELSKVNNSKDLQTAFKNYQRKRMKRVNLARKQTQRRKLMVFTLQMLPQSMYFYLIRKVPTKLFTKNYKKLLSPKNNI